METLLKRLARRWSAVEFPDLPDEAVEVGQHCMLDWFGCALGGTEEELTRVLRDELSAPGPGTLVGSSRTASVRDAALINGAAGHALDFDDTHTLMSGHPTAPVLPAALAVAEQTDATGQALVTALIVGIEVECRLGALMAPAHYRVGWHATGTFGTIGAAAAVAHLLGLDVERTTHALALAATQAAGLRASFGTMAKALHAGKAAADGLLAARLAARGFTGNPAVLEAPTGLAAAAGGAAPDEDRMARFDECWTIRDTLFKYHAACYLTHASINAALAVSDDLTPDEVDRVEVHVAPDLLQICNIAEPATGLEGKFSLRTTAAMALLGGDTADMAAFNDARMCDRDLVAMRDRVVVVPDEAYASTRAKVVVVTRTGDAHESEADTGRPAAVLTAQWSRLSSKFRGLAAPVLGETRTATLRDAVVRLAPARELTGLVTP